MNFFGYHIIKLSGAEAERNIFVSTTLPKNGTYYLQREENVSTVAWLRNIVFYSVSYPDPEPDWIRIQWGPWIRIQVGKVFE